MELLRPPPPTHSALAGASTWRPSGPGRFTLFLDEILGWDCDYTKRLFQSLFPSNLRWVAEMFLSAPKDEELLDLAAKSGCMGLGLGSESLSPEVITSIRKQRTNQPELHRELGGEGTQRLTLSGRQPAHLRDGSDAKGAIRSPGLKELSIHDEGSVKAQINALGVFADIPGLRFHAPVRPASGQAAQIPPEASGSVLH